MILEQRQRDVPTNKYNNYNNSSNTKYNNKLSISSMEPPPRNWRTQYKRRQPQNVMNNINNFNQIEEKPTVPVKSVPAQPLATAALAPYGRVYQDNWKHL